MRRALIALFTLLLGAGAVLTAAWGLAAPSHDRAWPPVYERVATVAHTPHGVRLGNVRNWSYAPDGTPARATGSPPGSTRTTSSGCGS